MYAGTELFYLFINDFNIIIRQSHIENVAAHLCIEVVHSKIQYNLSINRKYMYFIDLQTRPSNTMQQTTFFFQNHFK